MLRNACSALLACLLLLGSAGTSPTHGSRSAHAIKDTHTVPRAWTKVGIPSPDHMLKLTIALTQHRFEELEQHLIEVSDPAHSRYGQHLSQEEVDELARPSQEAFDQVREWLLDNDVQTDQLRYSPANDDIKVNLPVKTVERLLDTEYFVYEHTDGTRIVRTPDWSIPVHLHQYISMIQPTNSFLRADPQRSRVKVEDTWKRTVAAEAKPPLANAIFNAMVKAACNSSVITPHCLRTLYGTLNYTLKVPGNNSMALTNYLDETNNRSDASIFLQLFRPEAAAAAYQFTEISINNGTVAQTNTADLGTGIEGALDVQTMLGIAWPTNLITYSTGGLDPSFVADNSTTSDSDEPYLAWVNYMLALKTVPHVISTSYVDDEQTVSRAYAVHVCKKFAQLGARGVTLLFAAGDFGVGASGFCYSNSGSGAGYTFIPNFPASCPYVTAVGGTHGYPEVASYFQNPDFPEPFTSGGGFSNYFAMPSYQKKAVDPYIKGLAGVYDGLYNKSGRGFPDIAAQSQNVGFVWNGTLYGGYGTSCGSLAAAGVLTLVNDALIANGKGPLGFMNPWLYAGGWRAFTDVVSGSSAGCNTTGFPAVKGWDAVTGWGTPYFPGILGNLGLGM